MFVNPPQNSTIELLYGEGTELTAFHLDVNYSSDEFLAFTDEWPLEKIEQAAKDASKIVAVNAEEARKDWESTSVQRLKPKDVLDTIDKHNNNKEMLFEYKLAILDELSSVKNKAQQLKIRKSKTLKALLSIYYGI